MVAMLVWGVITKGGLPLLERWKIWIVLVAVVLVSYAHPSHAETFRFKSETKADKYTATIGGELSFPPGSGPFPVVVFLHACGGFDHSAQTSLMAHSRYMMNSGFGSLLLDNLGPRRLNGGRVCVGGEIGRQAMEFGIDDVFNALGALRKHSKVRGDNVFLVGQSYGAIVALWAARRAGEAQFFRAVAAFYPHCRPVNNAVILKSPVLVLAGAKDDWTPADICTHAKEVNRVPLGAELEVIVYPNALHSFDQPRRPITYLGHKLAYDAQATADSQKKMKEFFIRHLTDVPERRCRPARQNLRVGRPQICALNGLRDRMPHVLASRCDAVSICAASVDLLDYLIRNRERVVSKDDLWKGRIVYRFQPSSQLTV
jgi:dienelactone hydrolase